MSSVILRRKGSLGIATLNAESSLNALSLDMIDQLYPQLKEWQADDSIKAVWLEGAGDKAFCAGGDIVSLHKEGKPTDKQKAMPQANAFFEREYRLDYLLYRFGKPVVCWANGIVMGGGIGLLAGCSHRIVTTTSRLAMPEITIGLYPDVGASRFLSRMPGHIGLFLGLTGTGFNAADAHYIGLGDHLLDNSAREDVLAALIHADWQDDTRQNDAVVSRLLRRFTLPLEEWPEMAIKPRFDLINDLCDADELPTIVDNICDYPGNDEWIKKAAATLAKGCPQTAWLVWIAQLKAPGKSLADIFRMEWIMSVQCARHPDLYEGVRALLIDKDKNPVFQHKHVRDVPEAYMEAFFEMPAGVDKHPLEDL